MKALVYLLCCSMLILSCNGIKIYKPTASKTGISNTMLKGILKGVHLALLEENVINKKGVCLEVSISPSVGDSVLVYKSPAFAQKIEYYAKESTACKECQEVDFIAEISKVETNRNIFFVHIYPVLKTDSDNTTACVVIPYEFYMIASNQEVNWQCHYMVRR